MDIEWGFRHPRIFCCTFRSVIRKSPLRLAQTKHLCHSPVPAGCRASMSSLASTSVSTSAAVWAARPGGARQGRGFETATHVACKNKVPTLSARRRRAFRHPSNASPTCTLACPEQSRGDAETGLATAPTNIAIIGAGFAGVAIAYHVFKYVAEKHAETTETNDTSENQHSFGPVTITLIDEKAIAGGASGVAAGLLHPYTPRGKLIWRGVEGVDATLALVAAAEAAEAVMESGDVLLKRDVELDAFLEKKNGTSKETKHRGQAVGYRAGVCRPARDWKQALDLAKHCGGAYDMGGRGVAVDVYGLKTLVPGISVPIEVADAIAFEKEQHTTDETTQENNKATAGLYVPEGVVLDTARYLCSLWDATRLLAFGDETPDGCGASIEIRTVASLQDDCELQKFHAVVVACGAGAGSISELGGDKLPTKLQGGHVVEMVPAVSSFVDDDDTETQNSSSKSWPAGAPGILGSPYIAPLGPQRLLVGTTKDYGATVCDARNAGVVEFNDDESNDESNASSESNEKSDRQKQARSAGVDLVHKASQIYPPLGDAHSWVVDTTRYGVRANPPRSNLGSLPLVGRILPTHGDDGGEKNHDSKHAETKQTRWYVGGLGARGLVYHGMLGEIVARAVLEDDDTHVPKELRFDPGKGEGSV